MENFSPESFIPSFPASPKITSMHKGKYNPSCACHQHLVFAPEESQQGTEAEHQPPAKEIGQRQAGMMCPWYREENWT